MPGGDRTGPLGQGPLTGWGRGLCAGRSLRGFEQTGYGGGRGFGRGRGAGGGGFGWRHVFWGTGAPGWARVVVPGVAATGETRWLEARASMLESELAAVREQIARVSRAREEGQVGAQE